MQNGRRNVIRLVVIITNNRQLRRSSSFILKASVVLGGIPKLVSGVKVQIEIRGSDLGNGYDFNEIMMRRVGDLPIMIFERGNALVDLASTQHIQHKSEGSAYK